ncbi:MAG: polyphenol oxidase family protein [Candidatus Hydrogenedentes bacterium]|nr:polyphenol oxidase family protein [Candidatus Hydrogenedentota bacterium]
MMRFPEYEALGVRVAAISDKSDGDCGFNARDGGAARQRYFEQCGVSAESVVQAHQVHGNHVAVAGPGDGGRGTKRTDTAIPDTDALITATPGLALGIRVADCVPVYLFDPVRKAIGLVHAGRVGTMLDIAGATVTAMVQEFGTSPECLHALIGPSAGPGAYEVSQEMADEFTAAGLPVTGRFLDLWQANFRQLAASGIPENQISIVGECTITGGRFHTHRGHPDGQRNLGLLML